MKILLTGLTGNIGHEVARQLAGHQVMARVRDVTAAPVMEHVALLREDELDAARACEIIIHCAASTTFNAPLQTLREVNVEMTQNLLDFAVGCPALKRFVHVSTACVCGLDGGLIPENSLPEPSAFVNAYEQSKWEAEQRVLASGLPVCIARLSIVAGSEVDGSVRKRGALHHLLFWLWKGLIPMMPGTAETPVDMISTEHAARGVVSAALADAAPPVIHVCAGGRSPRLGELIQHVAQDFASTSAGWRSGAIAAPEIVDAETFALFEQTVQQSGDLLFQRVCTDSKSFLPGLLHSRVYATALAESLNPEPAYDWRKLSTLVTHHVLARHHA
ncbi:SDR family oxidoreductase [Prosthecobacter sp. SYSU 5D2]|uniref:SDR family oxidoreductase n=1 Tax=Prosthecobacter sp. SYSU 5D2 TaxID=3134134 RepID=UPI0031FEB8EE